VLNVRICIYGAGATGGHFAVKLARAGHEVSVVARGPHLAAMREKGLTLISGDQRLTARVNATDDPVQLGAQDLVIVTTKATGLPAVATGLAPLIGPATVVLYPQNGIPWWYPLGQQRGRMPDLPLFRLAPALLRDIPAERLLGGSIYSANAVVEPGVIRNPSVDDNRLVFAEVAAPPGLAAPLRAAIAAAGIGSADPGDARRCIWRKLLGNMSGSALALVTGTRSITARQDPALLPIYVRLVEEGLAIAAAHGHDLHNEVDARNARPPPPDHRPSLLQDYEAGRPMEIGEILLAPLAFARAAGVATPTLDAVAAVAMRLAADRGLFDRNAWPEASLW
jgi:2-dehydropantoate 2-reductase